jgi:ketopantoate hydroxymethyltransferase
VKKYSNLENIIDKSVKQFSKDVKDGKFPTKKYSY